MRRMRWRLGLGAERGRQWACANQKWFPMSSTNEDKGAVTVVMAVQHAGIGLDEGLKAWNPMARRTLLWIDA